MSEAANSPPESGTQRRAAAAMASREPGFQRRFADIEVTVWANRSSHGLWFNTTVKRFYRVGVEWNESGSFRRDDLPIVAKAVELAYAWIWEQHA